MPDPASLLVNIALFGSSPAITGALDQARAAGKHLAPVLLIAEPGLELGLLATQLHQWSRREGPFERVAGAELTVPNLERSGTANPLSGLIALPMLLEALHRVRGGTLFIEDIDELPGSAQAILESLLTRQSMGAGSSDVRLVASTSRDLARLVEQGSFRRGLLDRLFYAPIRVPPLRERDQDALILAERLLATHAMLKGRPERRLSDRAREVIQGHSWPGNVAELERVIVRAALESRDEVIRGSAVTRAIGEPTLAFASLRLSTALSRLGPVSAGDELAPERRSTALSEALDRLKSKEDASASDRSVGRALREALARLQDVVILRELERVERLTLQEVHELLKTDPETARRRLAALVRSGKIVQKQEARKAVWSLVRPAAGAAEAGPHAQG